MVSAVDPARPSAIHRFHAIVLTGAVPLFIGALLCDYAYWSSHHIQWSNFASWLLVGAMVLATIALACEIAALVRGRRDFVHLLLLAATWLVGFFDALHHGRDAWAIMPAALVLSAIAAALACVAAWIGISRLGAGGAP